ncbi:MAG: hypothetical protein H0U60_00115 [Blastocatellia bacterium]|nr:hypothetical protein [Blastocatellia bacterium]
MAHTALFLLNSATLFDVGTGFSGANNYALVEYNPAMPPADKDTGDYDLTSDLWDVMIIDVRGSSADNLIENLNALDRYFYECQLWEQDHNYPSGKGELEFAPQNATNHGKAKIAGGWVEMPRDLLAAPILSNMIFRAVVHFKRRPYFLGALATLTPTTAATDNDLNNFAALPSISGVMAQTRIRLVAGSGNSASCKRALVAVRASRNPANFVHILQAEAYTARGAGVADLTDANLSPGSGVSGQRYTPTTTNKIMLLRWEVTANLDDQKGKFMPLVIYRDNAASLNFRLHFRNGLKFSAGNFSFQPFSTIDPLKTMFNAGTTELGVLAMNQITNPPGGSALATVNAIVYELWGEALAVTGSLDIDQVKLFPVGEAGNGMGLQSAEFGQAFGTNRVYFDARDDLDSAYIANASDVILALPIDLPEGAPILLPTLRAGFRVYGLVMQDVVGLYKYNRTTTLTIQTETQQVYVRMRGTT